MAQQYEEGGAGSNGARYNFVSENADEPWMQLDTDGIGPGPDGTPINMRVEITFTHEQFTDFQRLAAKVFGFQFKP